MTRGVKNVEPARTAEEHAHLAAVLRRLATASRLEREGRRETDRLMAIAWKAGATDRTLAAAMDLTPDAARMRRRRAHLRRDPDRRGRSAVR